MKTIAMMSLLVPAMLATPFAHADDAQATKKHIPTQSELALDHGPHAQVTPAVKRARQQAANEAAKKATSDQSK
jgi:hypothetical protein